MRNHRKLTLLLLVSLATFLPSFSWAQTERNRTAALSAASATPPPGYRIGFGDVLQIVVFREPDASVAETSVRSDGKITMPFVGEVEVQGLSPSELEESLRQKLGPFIKDPDVWVLVKNVQSEKVVVLGAVKKGGPIRLVSSMTILEALSEAGLDDFAKPNKIYLLRTQGSGQVRIPFRYKDVIQGKHPDQNIVLKPGDTIVVP
jgi:polysaccharide export outer membrane protein